MRMRSRGFTLVETLVTLVIVAFITSLVAEGLFQLTRIERSLQSEQAQPRLEALHEQWVVLALKGLVVTDVALDAPFQGSATEISGQSTMAPVLHSVGPTPLRLSLQSQDGISSLWVETGAVGPEPATRAKLGEWPWADVHWVFQDLRGQAYTQWPPVDFPAGQLPQALPSLIRLEADGGRRLLLLAAPENNYIQAPKTPGQQEAL